MCQFCGRPIEPKDETWDEDMFWDAINGMPEDEVKGEDV